MTRPLLLDANVLSKIVYPKNNNEIVLWFRKLVVKKEFFVVLPEISDYEVRRGLLHKDIFTAIKRLDKLKETLDYLPITTEIMLKAADLWALARKEGFPTSGPKELDCDIILSAYCIIFDGIIITENIRHFKFVEAISYKDIN